MSVAGEAAPLPIRPAATLIVMRDGAPPELLMVQRSEALAFGGGAWVFPGGRVDAADQALAEALATPGMELADLAARVAAIRETIEEAGLPLGLDPLPDPATLAAIRAALHAGEPLANLLHAHGLALRLGDILPFARWITPPDRSRRFDTRFYLARATHDRPADADGGETVALGWHGARAMLERHGGARLMFPTFATLHRLALHADFAAAADAVPRAHDPVEVGADLIDGARFHYVKPGWGYPDVRQMESSDT